MNIFPKRHTDGQQVHEKVLNTPSPQRNADSNHGEVALAAWLSSKRLEVTNVGEDVERREVLCVVGGNVNWCGHYEKQCGVSSEIINRTII